MIRARLPKHVAPAHALETAEHVLQRVVERMPHMQRAGDIGRRDDDGKRFCRATLRSAGAECARLLPGRIDALLHLGRLVGLVDHRHFDLSAVAR
jgi:hypothetical protein